MRVFFARATEAGTKVGVFESKKYFFSDQWISDSIEGPILISKLVANKPFFEQLLQSVIVFFRSSLSPLNKVC